MEAEDRYDKLQREKEILALWGKSLFDIFNVYGVKPPNKPAETPGNVLLKCMSCQQKFDAEVNL